MQFHANFHSVTMLNLANICKFTKTICRPLIMPVGISKKGTVRATSLKNTLQNMLYIYMLTLLIGT